MDCKIGCHFCFDHKGTMTMFLDMTYTCVYMCIFLYIYFYIDMPVCTYFKVVRTWRLAVNRCHRAWQGLSPCVFVCQCLEGRCSAVLIRHIDCLGSFSVCLSGSPYISLSLYLSLSLSLSLSLFHQDIDWVQTEKHVFEQASTNPFLVGLHSCFQTESR